MNIVGCFVIFAIYASGIGGLIFFALFIMALISILKTCHTIIELIIQEWEEIEYAFSFLISHDIINSKKRVNP